MSLTLSELIFQLDHLMKKMIILHALFHCESKHVSNSQLWNSAVLSIINTLSKSYVAFLWIFLSWFDSQINLWSESSHSCSNCWNYHTQSRITSFLIWPAWCLCNLCQIFYTFYHGWGGSSAGLLLFIWHLITYILLNIFGKFIPMDITSY